MKTHFLQIFTGLPLLLLTAVSLTASAGEGPPAIPAVYDVSRYEASWRGNPFEGNRAPAPAAARWENEWSLAGMSRTGGRELVIIVNKHTGESRRLTLPEAAVPDPDFKLLKTHFNRARDKASAEVSKEATLKYQDAK